MSRATEGAYGQADGLKCGRRVRALLGCVAALALLSACGGDAEPVASTPAPVATLTVSESTVASGGTATLTWSSTNATACTASGGWSGALATSGTQTTAALTATTTFDLSCTGSGGSSKPAAATVTVEPPATAVLTASPASVTSGGSSTLSWSSTNASSCTASGGWTGPLSTSGTQSTGALTASTTYALTCTGAGGASSAASAVVTVTPATPVTAVTLSATPTAVVSGSASLLTWSSTNATACTASGAWSGSEPTSGTLSTGPLTAATTYSLTCSGPSGPSAVASVQVTLVPAPTVSLTAAPTAVASGTAATLSWSATNATACTASGGWTGAKAVTGTQSTGALTLPSSYTLTCTGPAGSGAATTLVNVVPTATLTANPAVVTSGGVSTLTWSSINATACTASGGWSGALATGGTQATAALTATTTYSLICTGPGGSSNAATATVTLANGSVAVSPKTASLTQTETQQFAATVPAGGTATWAVDGVSGGNAAVGTVTSAGLYTAGSAVGTHTVVATNAANTAQSGSATVAVTDLAGVYTQHDDLARDGANAHEYALTPATVNTTQFGKLFSCTADGAIYAQPLWIANQTVNGAQHNVVIVATQHDSLFAFDADASPCVTLWSVSLIDTAHGAAAAGETSVPSGVPGYLVGSGQGDITPEVGVTSTPVVDPSTGTVYVHSKSVNAGKTTIYQRLHAINLATGAERTGSPVTITATFPGTGSGGTSVAFDPKQEAQRPGLTLSGGVVYLAWASHEDTAPWFGWVMGYTYNGSTFTQSHVLNLTPNAGTGGIWMSGGGMPVDSNGSLYAITGNGGFDAANTTGPTNDYGDSLVCLTPSLTVSQYFTPNNQAHDQSNDEDFGSGGAAVLADLPAGSPFTHLIMGGGKDGGLYVLNRDSLGGLDPTSGPSKAVQKLSVGSEIYATGAFWNNRFYMAAVGKPMVSYLLDPATAQFSTSSSSTLSYAFPGATPSVSAAGAQAGIVWALDTSRYCTAQSTACGPAVLHAYDATNLASELWNSGMVAGDAAGNAVKFTVPTVANGRVYVGTRGNNSGGVYGSTTVSGELDVYGLLPN